MSIFLSYFLADFKTYNCIYFLESVKKRICYKKVGSPKILEAIGFNLPNHFNLNKNSKVDIVFNLREDNWNGNRRIQLRIIDLKISD